MPTTLPASVSAKVIPGRIKASSSRYFQLMHRGLPAWAATGQMGCKHQATLPGEPAHAQTCLWVRLG